MSGKLREGDFAASITSRPDIRLYFVYGPDESAVSTIASTMVRNLGTGLDIVELDSTKLRGDPAILADEAASGSLFGDKRLIRVNFLREEGVDAVDNLLTASVVENPVIATAGDLKKTSKLRKLVEGSPYALSYICYMPEEGQIIDMIAAKAREAGLKLNRALAARIAAYTGGDRRLAAGEIEKLALYYDAAPERPVLVEASVLALLSAETVEEDVQGLVNKVMSGDLREAVSEIATMKAAGVEPVRVVRAFQRRVALLGAMRAKVDAGGQAGAVVRAARGVFWKDYGTLERQVQRWPSQRIAGLNRHLLDIEAQIMAKGSDLGGALLEEELARLARTAARAR